MTESPTIEIPELALVLLVGPSGSGKSTFARKHFLPTEVLSSDACRGLVADDQNDQSATPDAFDVLHFIARKRLAARRLTVVDATNVQPESRRSLVRIAREQHALAVAIVLSIAPRICHERNATRADRAFGPHVVRQQTSQLKRSLRDMKREGFHVVVVLESPEAVDAATIVRRPLWTDRRFDRGPFDIIGDVHGCLDELERLLDALGYRRAVESGDAPPHHPDGRRAIFLGDLVDRGPSVPGVLSLVMSMVRAGSALCVAGNHDNKLARKLAGRDVRITHGLAETLAQLETTPAAFKDDVREFIEGLVSHYVLDDGKLVVAHAGLKEELQGRASRAVREFALYGETTGETDAFGLPVRFDWARSYRGRASVVYGHTPVPEPEWVNGTVCIDTGCVFGGKLTALRYPEREIVAVSAARKYYEPAKPFLAEGVDAAAAPPERAPDQLDIADVTGKRIVQTRIHRSVTISEESAAAALEVMSRFAVDPRWLVYLPPTMSPCEAAADGEALEQPRDAFAYYRAQGVPRVVCEEKHMGSRAVIVVCRDESVARKRFGSSDADRFGVIYTRTGRRFFDGASASLERPVLEGLRTAMDAARMWDELATDWVCLDAEVLPWSAKARELLRVQYAPVGSAGRASLSHAVGLLEQLVARSGAPSALLDRFRGRLDHVERYVEAYRRYCWRVESANDLRIAPFHILATEGRVRTRDDEDHPWHMRTLEKLSAVAPDMLRPTEWRVVDVTSPASEAEATSWWEALTARGGEGMVVKPITWLARGAQGSLVQPAVKCRGPEYLRIIYGPEHTAPEHLARLRNRAVSAKRRLALRELALGLEALHRFVDREPLYRVHECVFGVLALESEPIDPRL